MKANELFIYKISDDCGYRGPTYFAKAQMFPQVTPRCVILSMIFLWLVLPACKGHYAEDWKYSREKHIGYWKFTEIKLKAEIRRFKAINHSKNKKHPLKSADCTADYSCNCIPKTLIDISDNGQCHGSHLRVAVLSEFHLQLPETCW